MKTDELNNKQIEYNEFNYKNTMKHVVCGG
jgi:hypothetical protein